MLEVIKGNIIFVSCFTGTSPKWKYTCFNCCVSFLYFLLLLVAMSLKEYLQHEEIARTLLQHLYVR